MAGGGGGVGDYKAVVHAIMVNDSEGAADRMKVARLWRVTFPSLEIRIFPRSWQYHIAIYLLRHMTLHFSH